MEIAIDTRLSHVEFQQTSTLLSRLQKNSVQNQNQNGVVVLTGNKLFNKMEEFSDGGLCESWLGLPR